MNTVMYSEILERITYSVEVVRQGEVICSGSAVAINRTGYLATAAHVVVRLNSAQRDAGDPEVKIYAKTRDGQYQEYTILICAPTTDVADFMSKPLVIDLAILEPKNPSLNIPHLEVRDQVLKLGEPILMAGFPDETELPFSFDRLLNPRHPEFLAQKDAIKLARRLLMVKSGIIANISGFSIESIDTNEVIEGEIFYIDNVMHSGASGGPVVTSDGKIAGIILQRATIDASSKDASDLWVPSGSAVAITPRAIVNILRRAARKMS